MKYGGYAETIEMAMCPSVTYVSTVDYTTNYRHYGLNYKAYLGGISRFSMAGWSRTEDGFVNMGLLSRRIDRPADFILGADTNNQSLAATGVYVMITYFEPGSYAIWLIHQRMANTFFLDGHVARLGRGELATGLTSTMKFSYY
jgi:prepilin-type processing-associated H-X9-DG protein